MDKLKFHVDIHASSNKVWEILWNDDTYRKWTSVFNPGSYAESDWKEGSKIRFLAEDGLNGMHSQIDKLVPGKTMVFRHIGEVRDGQELDSTLSGAMESYFLSEKDGVTSLEVELDSVGEYKDYFSETFPRALQLVKEISEHEKD